MASKQPTVNRYAAIIERIFLAGYRKGAIKVPFVREDLVATAKRAGIELPKNLGDLLYSFRYRNALPESILKTAAPGNEWIIESIGVAKYAFLQTKINRIVPRADLVTTKIPDATPEIVAGYAQGDEQALLAKVRYNRLIDIFLGVAAYSLQNHLRTTVKGIGQIEIDELYVAIDKFGAHYAIPVQAKGGKDQLSVVQSKQDIAYCLEKFPGLKCRPVSAQFMEGNRIAMFELALEGGEIRVAGEAHYTLVPVLDIEAADIAAYRDRAKRG